MKKIDLIKAFLATMIAASCVAAQGVWLESNYKTYSVTNGVVVGVSSESNYTYTSYTDDKHYEYEMEYTSSDLTQTGNYSRNGNTTQSVSHQITATYDLEYNTTSVYDEESGILLSMISTTIGTINGEAYNNSSETNYTIELLKTEGNIKTYKHYSTETGGTSTYQVNKIQNGITLESKLYTNGDVLYYTLIYMLPNNATIRAKIPDFTIYSINYETAPANNIYSNCEVISDSEIELVIRVKTYNTATGVLTGQYEVTYIRYGDDTPIGKTAATKAMASIGFAGIKNGQINLNLKAGTYTAQLYNLQRRLIKSVDINAANGINAVGLRIDNLSKGIFILNVKQAGVSVLKQKIAVK